MMHLLFSIRLSAIRWCRVLTRDFTDAVEAAPFKKLVKRSAGPALWRGVVSLLLGGMLLSCTQEPATEEEKAAWLQPALEGNRFDTSPVRGELKPMELTRSGFNYRCMECHRDLTAPKEQLDFKGEHVAIAARFNHGLNTQCVNCHHPSNRNAFVDHDGGEIPSTQPARLCAKCHGPLYREWQRGAHGRQNGHWDRSKGPRVKLLCVQCHDPHEPAFKAMKPDPTPAYSRFEEHAPVAHGGEES
jgi:hypothetical protein